VAANPGKIEGRRFLRAMSRLGWVLESQRGSHPKLVHPQKGVIIVASHGTIRRQVVHSILRDASIGIEEFLRTVAVSARTAGVPFTAHSRHLKYPVEMG